MITSQTSMIAGSRGRVYLIAFEIRLVNTCLINPGSHWMDGKIPMRHSIFRFAVSPSSPRSTSSTRAPRLTSHKLNCWLFTFASLSRSSIRPAIRVAASLILCK